MTEFCVVNMRVYPGAHLKIFKFSNKYLNKNAWRYSSSNVESETAHSGGNEDEFRVLELFPRFKKEQTKKERRVFVDAQVAPPREKRMPIDQDWPSVWPTAKTFRPSVVPLPIYQGYDKKRAPPDKYANAELMKIPNFLHLTPLAIKRHCEAIKKFCTSFPKGLETDEDCFKHFPVQITTSDYLHASPTIRDERSRIVTLKVKLSRLNLDYHGRDKLLRLIGNERYDKNSGLITLVADRCPLRKQNYDYLIYLLTAIHHESWVTEPWEHEKTEADMEKFFFENSRIERHALETVSKIDDKPVDAKCDEITHFGESVAAVINEGESEETMQKYKESVVNLLKLN